MTSKGNTGLAMTGKAQVGIEPSQCGRTLAAVGKNTDSVDAMRLRYESGGGINVTPAYILNSKLDKIIAAGDNASCSKHAKLVKKHFRYQNFTSIGNQNGEKHGLIATAGGAYHLRGGEKGKNATHQLTTIKNTQKKETPKQKLDTKFASEKLSSHPNALGATEKQRADTCMDTTITDMTSHMTSFGYADGVTMQHIWSKNNLSAWRNVKTLNGIDRGWPMGVATLGEPAPKRLTGSNPVALNSSDAIRALYGEACGEPYEAKLLVAATIRNRGSLKGIYGGSNPILKRKIDAKAMKDCEKAWKASADICVPYKFFGGRIDDAYFKKLGKTPAKTVGNTRFYE